MTFLYAWSPGLSLAAVVFVLAALPLLRAGRWGLTWLLGIALAGLLALGITLVAARLAAPMNWWRWFLASFCLFAVPVAAAITAAALGAKVTSRPVAVLAAAIAGLLLGYVPSVLAASRFLDLIVAVQD